MPRKRLGGDPKRVTLAADRSIPETPDPDKGQLTIDDDGCLTPTAPRKQRNLRSKDPKYPRPVAFVVTHSKEPTTPETREEETLFVSPASHFRGNIIRADSPTDASVFVGTTESPRLIQQAGPKGSRNFLARIMDLRMPSEEKENPPRVLLFGHTGNPETYTDLNQKQTTWSDEKFRQFRKKGWLTAIASSTTETLEITPDSIEENAGIPRSVKQDDVMKHTAISHIKRRGLAVPGVPYQWGHRLAHTLKATPPTPKDLEVVGPVANMYESRMTAGLKDAMKEPGIQKIGHWELTVTSHHMEVVNRKTREKSYLPNISHTQEYHYCYTNLKGKRSELLFVVNPLDPNSVSYQQTTEMFKNIFSAVMKGTPLFNSQQRKLDFSQAASADDIDERTRQRMNLSADDTMDTEEDVESSITVLPTIIASEASQQQGRKRKAEDQDPDSQDYPREAIHSEVLAGLELQKIKGNGHCFYSAAGLYLGKDFEELRKDVADYMQEHIADLLEFWSGDKESLEEHIKRVRSNSKEWADQLEIQALQDLTGRPVIIIKPDAPPTIPDNIREYTKPPIFVFYNNRYRHGDAHYEALIVKDGYTAESILETLLRSKEAGCVITHPGRPTVKIPQPNLMAFFTRDPGIAAKAQGAAVETPDNLMAMMKGDPTRKSLKW